MIDPALQLERQLRAPLAGLRGARPPAPAWFDDALARAPERSRIQVEGAGVELLTWGPPGAQGVLFVHGGWAHADWWSFIAPFFADRYRVAALSLSGMGGSDWRARYSVTQYARELVAAMDAADLGAGGRGPVVVGHSFGSRPLLVAAASGDVQLAGAVVLDATVPKAGTPDDAPAPARPRRVYADLVEALTHFRLLPPQPCENLFLLDHIARRSLKPAPRPDGGQGYAWRFDPALWSKATGDEAGLGVRALIDQSLRGALCPLAFVYGEQSAIVRPGDLAYTRAIAPAGTPFVRLPNAAHHLLLDQPLKLVDTLRSILAGWGL